MTVAKKITNIQCQENVLWQIWQVHNIKKKSFSIKHWLFLVVVVYVMISICGDNNEKIFKEEYMEILEVNINC